jgi:undecaprenyl-diphosphatase
LTRRDQELLTYLAAGLLASILIVLLLAHIHHDIVHPRVERLDLTVQSWAHAHSSPALTVAMELLTEIGAPRTDVPLCVAIAGLLWWKRQPREASLLLGSMLGAGCLVAALKLHFKRIRPDVAWHWGHEHSYSFPSGHSVMAVVLYGTLLYLFLRWLRRPWQRWLAIVAALLLALAIGYSRIYLGAHFPSDVLAGYGCGSIWLATIVYADLLVRREIDAAGGIRTLLGQYSG